MPEVIILDDPAAVAARAAALLSAAIRDRPDLVLGLPTGATPEATYQCLVQACRAGRLSFRKAVTINVDEYLGVGAGDPRSYAAYMQARLFGRIDIDPGNTHLPDGLCVEPNAEAARYDRLIQRLGGLDCLFLGLGRNGHLAFNEPGSARSSRTRVVKLAPETLAANRRHFSGPETQPDSAITIGLANILEARRVILVAVGPAKAAAVRSLFAGRGVAECPAAILREHPRAEIILDRAAAAKLGTGHGSR